MSNAITQVIMASILEGMHVSPYAALVDVWEADAHFSHPVCFYTLHHRGSCLTMPHSYTHCGLCHHFLPAVYSRSFLQHPITRSPDDLTATVPSTTSSDCYLLKQTPRVLGGVSVTRWPCVEKANCLLFKSAL